MGIGIHTKPYRGLTDEWLTPPEILKALGSFDLDPCAPLNRPWDTAAKHHTIEDDGLAQTWEGRVWLNPPYGPQTWKWLERLAAHGDGIALTFARTETEGFFRTAWRADALLFFKGRLYFHHATGQRASGNAGGPSVLLAFGERNVQALRDSGIPGALVLNPEVAA